MKTIAQQLNVTEFPFEIRDKNGNVIYCEGSNGCWYRNEYDSANNKLYYENSDEFWIKRKYDSDGRVICFEKSNGYWEKWQYDSDGRVIYYEDSDGLVQGISITQSQSQEGRKVKKTIAQQLKELLKEAFESGRDYQYGGDPTFEKWCNKEVNKTKAVLCNVCGTVAEKRYDHYWCKYCHHEFLIKNTEQ
jgi:hypothetical protein